MAAKKGKKSHDPADLKLLVVEKAMELSADKGWENVSLRDIAERSEVKLSDFREHFDDKADILAHLERMIDKRVLDNLPEAFDDETGMCERLFDILMDRFEALNEYRDGLVAVLDSFKYDPKQAVIGMPNLCRSMTWMLEAAGDKTDGIKGAVKVAGLTGLYLKVLRTWKDDDSPDLPKTMAALDKALNRAETVLNTFDFAGKRGDKTL